MKKFLLILTCSVFVLLFATEKEDFFFIKALMQDKYYQLALDETKDFIKKYPHSEFKNEISLIQADIMIQKKEYIEAETILNSINNNRLSPILEQYWLLLQTENSQNIGQEDLMFMYANTYLKKYGKLEEANKMYLFIGDNFMKENNFIKAKEYYTKINKGNAEANFRLLKLYLESGERNTADSLYADILAHDKNLANVDFATIILVDYQEKHKEWSNLKQIIDNYFDTYHNSQFIGLNEVQQNLFFHNLNALIQLNEFDLVIENIGKYDSTDDRKTYYQGLALIKKGELVEGIQILEQLVSTTIDPEIKSNSFFQIINSKSSGDINSTIEELNNFLINNPDQKWTGDIYYQIAFSLYKQKNYNDAIGYLDKALSFGTGNIGTDIQKREFEEKVYFLKTECLFYLSKKKECINIASDFYKKYPNSVFIDELMFKLSICLYQTSQIDSSYFYFKKIVTDYPNSAKTGMSNYYLGEIELSKKHYNLAKEYFRVALTGKIDLGAAYLKLSYIEYALKDYSKAKTLLASVPEEEDYLFDKYLLMGNIVFNERKYSDALKNYKKAESKVPDQLSLELIWARQAWTLNLLKRYDEAKNIYKQLSEQFNEPGKYKLAAANAAYNAENYLQAIELFTEYLKEYPNSEENYKVISGIANSQFNLSNYEDAISKWDNLVNEKYSKEIIENAILGIQWSYQQLNNKKEYSKWINDRIKKTNNEKLKVTLYESKIKYEYDNKDYLSSISSILQLFQQYPDKEKDEKLQVLLANNYIWQKQYEKADRIYVQLVINNKSPQVYYEWGHIKWAQNDIPAAMKRYKMATEDSQQPDYWLTLLEKLEIIKDEEFQKYYDNFNSFADDYYKELAKLIMIEKHINSKDFNSAMTVIDSLDTSDNPLVRAKAVFYRAQTSYLKSDLDSSLKDFLRLRYIYTEYSELRWNAEYYICRIYIDKKDFEKANEQFKKVKDNLTEAQSKELKSLLEGAGQ